MPLPNPQPRSLRVPLALCRWRRALACALGTCWAAPGLAQSATPPPPSGSSGAAAATEEDETITLTPFEVTASAEVGYQASSTLAGTRIRTDLRDVGSAISVATKQFMRDLGATDAQTLLPYLTSSEVGGVYGNFFLGSQVADAATINDNIARQNPQGNTRIRGLNAADNTRDFFITDIPFDTYNTSRVDIQRGANSILYGNGSGAGIVNAATDGALFGNNSVVVQARYGSFGSYRGSVNLNRELIRGELALRVATLYDHEHYRQQPAFDRDVRTFAAARYEPKFLRRGSARTSLKLSFEHGEIRANRPRVTTINDALSPWFIRTPIELRSPTPLNRPSGIDPTLLGVLTPMKWRAGYDPFVTGIPNASLDPARRDLGARATFSATTNPNAEPWIGAFTKTHELGGTRIESGFDGSGGGYGAWLAQFDEPGSSAVSRLVYPTIGETMFHAVDSAGVRDGQPIAGIRAPDLAGLLRLDQYASRGIGSLLYTLQGLWRANTITDPSTFDFFNHLIDGPNKGEGANFNAFNVTIDQTFWHERLGFQLAFDRQDYRGFRWAMLNQPTLTMDIYTHLPVARVSQATGLFEPLPNPNFGRPFVVSQSDGAANTRTKLYRLTKRFTPFADLDFKDLLKRDTAFTRIVGRHTFTGLVEEFMVEREDTRWRRHAVDPLRAAEIFGSNRPLGSAERNIATVSYLGPSIANRSSMAGLQLSPITARQVPSADFGRGTNTAAPPLAFVFSSRWTGPALPAGAGASFTPPPLGLAPNAVGGNATTQAENPLNYAAWSGSPVALPIEFAELGAERALSTTNSLRKTTVSSQALVDQWRLFDENVILTAGVRRDTIETFIPGDPALPATARARTGHRPVPNTTGTVDWDASFAYPDSPSSRYRGPWLKTYGAVVHSPRALKRRLPWGLEASLFYSRSENLQPAPRKDAITGEDLAPPAGTTKDYGFLISALDGRVSLRATRFETKVRGATLPDNSLLNFLRDEVTRGIQFARSVLYIHEVNRGLNRGDPDPAGNGVYHFRAHTLPNAAGDLLDESRWYPWEPARAPTAEQPWTLAEWQSEEAHALRAANAFMDSLQTPEAQRFLAANNIDPSGWVYHVGNNNISSQAPAGAAVTGDTWSSGDEFELFVRPLENWSIVANAAKTFATRLNLAGNAAQWFARRWALYNEPDPEYPGGLLAGDVRWFGGAQANAGSGHARFGRNGYKFFSEYRALEGTNVPELRPWRFNVITNYAFRRGLLRGAFVGGAYRWEDKSVIGFGVTEQEPELIREIDGTTQSVRPAMGALDPDQPFYGPREKHLDLWVGYNRRLWAEVDWRLQLNVTNVGERARLLPITTNPTGEGAAFRIAEGMTWRLTTTFSF